MGLCWPERPGGDPRVERRQAMASEKSEHSPSGPDSAVLRSFFAAAPFQMGITELLEDEDLLMVSVNRATADAAGMRLADLQGTRISELGLSGPRRGVWLEQY